MGLCFSVPLHYSTARTSSIWLSVQTLSHLSRTRTNKLSLTLSHSHLNLISSHLSQLTHLSHSLISLSLSSLIISHSHPLTHSLSHSLISLTHSLSLSFIHLSHLSHSLTLTLSLSLFTLYSLTFNNGIVNEVSSETCHACILRVRSTGTCFPVDIALNRCGLWHAQRGKHHSRVPSLGGPRGAIVRGWKSRRWLPHAAIPPSSLPSILPVVPIRRLRSDTKVPGFRTPRGRASPCIGGFLLSRNLRRSSLASATPSPRLQSATRLRGCVSNSSLPRPGH